MQTLSTPFKISDLDIKKKDFCPEYLSENASV
jgi:hypothetical protein